MKRIQARMKHMLAAAVLLAASTAQAQEAPENYVPYPYAFVTLQGGGQTTFTDYNNWKLFTPTASVSFGVQFTPVIGTRLHVNGIWNKGGICQDGVDQKYKYKYATTDLDLMVNMVNLICKGNYHPLGVYLIGGVGLNYAWGTHEAVGLSSKDIENRLSHNFRVGVMCDYKVARNWSVNLEVDGNSLSDRFNCKTSNCDDWQLTAQLGVTYRFGLRHKVKSDPRSNIIVDPSTIGTGTEKASAGTDVAIEKPAPKPEPKPAPAPAVVKQDIRRDIFFDIRQTSLTSADQVKINEVAAWLKEHPEAKVTVTGYADKGTGNSVNNERFAKERAENVTKALVKKGVNKSRITTDSKGDRVQPFTENDKNRVTIIIGKE